MNIHAGERERERVRVRARDSANERGGGAVCVSLSRTLARPYLSEGTPRVKCVNRQKLFSTALTRAG